MDMSLFERQALETVVQAFAAAFAPPTRMTVSEWSDQNRVLTSAESSEQGRWKTDRVPFMREIMDRLSPGDPTQTVVFMKSTQVGGTEGGVNWAGYVVDQAPAPMLVVEPTLDIGKLWSQQRFDNMVAGCRSLQKKLPQRRSRDGGNTVMLKTYAGGVMRVGGANSAVSLRSMPAKYLFLDEVDGYPDDLDGEGDPIKLAMERTNNFPRRKIFICSTPTIHEASNVERYFEQSDQRYYLVPCPHCQHKQRLVQTNMHYWFAEGQEGSIDGLQDVTYICEECGSHIAEHHKTWMLEHGEWVPTYPDRPIRGYHINSFYSPVGLGRTWLERAQDFLVAKNDPLKLKVFVNTVLGQTWKLNTADLKWEKLRQRALPYTQRTVPSEVLLLTAGIDTQDDRLEMYVWGWGRGSRCWLIERILIPGSPALSQTWVDISNHLATVYRSSADIPMHIESAAIDTGGHFSHEVYAYVRGYIGVTRLFAIAGRDNRPFVSRPTAVDIKTSGGVIPNGLKLWQVGVSHGKSALYGWLSADADPEAEQYFVNFPNDLDEDFYRQLTAEVFDPTKKIWKKRKDHPRNEALDCWNYAYWAACAPPLRINNAQPHDWDARERLFQPPTADMFSAGPPVTTTEPVQPVTQESPAPSGASSFLGESYDGWLDRDD